MARKENPFYYSKEVKPSQFDTRNRNCKDCPERIQCDIMGYPCKYQMIDLFEREGLIYAIKECRSQTGWGLRESKDHVEKIKEEWLGTRRGTF